MSFVLIIALIVAVAALSWMVATQGRTIENYERELTNKAKAPRVGRVKRNGSK